VSAENLLLNNYNSLYKSEMCIEFFYSICNYLRHCG